MVLHVCERCGYSTPRKSSLDNHLSRKSPCFRPPPQVVRSPPHSPHSPPHHPPKNQCNKCRRVFSRSDSLKRHITGGACKGAPPEMCTSQCAICRHVDCPTCAPGAMLSAPVPETDAAGPSGNHIVTNNNIVTNTQQNNNVTININAFCAEEIEHLLSNKRRMDGYVSAAYRAIPKMIKDVYFDAAHPENRTVRYPNVRASHMQVATREGDWQFRDKTEVIREMMESNLEHLGEHAGSRECKVHPFALKKFKECYAMLDAFLQESGDDARAVGVWRRVQKDVEMMIMSNRKVLANR